ncbi:MAG: ISL3 family transposase [Planctomycetota bacterium]
MHDTTLYASILGVVEPWKVTEVRTELDKGQIVVHVEMPSSTNPGCPKCGKACSRHDHRERRWRHLPTCQYQTILEVNVPRVRCEEHGVLQAGVPWAEENSSFTALMEALVISWLKEASISAVAELMSLSWDQVDGIMQRAVRRGLSRREAVVLRRVGVDETSFQKRHEYVTVVTDLDSSRVLYVADDRKAASLQGFFDQFEPTELLSIEVVAMDMWQPYITTVQENVWEAEKKICFDKFHVAKHLGDGVDKVRRQEQRQLVAEGDTTLTGSKYRWLQNPEGMTSKATAALDRLKNMALKTARAWALKEHAMCLWNYASRGWARIAWRGWVAWAMRSRLEPMKRVALMVREHLEGIINAIVHKATNAASESVNARIQHVKRMACGFRNRDRFRNAIYFHLGGLDMSPATHTIS